MILSDYRQLTYACLVWAILPVPALALWSQPLPEDVPYSFPDDSPVHNTPDADADQTRVEPAVLDRSRDWLADYLDSLSGNLDSFFVDTFFSDDLIEDDVRGSRAKISLTSRREAGVPVDYSFGLSLKLVLPGTNERMRLLVQSEDDEDEPETDALRTVDNVNYSTALRFLISKLDGWTTDFDAGIRWRPAPDPFVRLRSRNYWNLSEWELRTTQSFFYFTSDGWGEETYVRMDYPLNTEKLFRLDATAEYFVNNDYFDLAYNATLFHELSPSSVLAYNAGATGDSIDGPTFYSYYAGVRYRRQIYRNWIFAEVAPQFEWHRDNEYRTTPVLILRLESVIAQDLF